MSTSGRDISDPSGFSEADREKYTIEHPHGTSSGPIENSDKNVSVDSNEKLLGKLIDGRYLVTARVARGGMASVYLATDQRLERPVALKVMHPHLAESNQFTARFSREARAAAKISHPGVVPVYDQGIVDGQGYLVMEFIDGPNLRRTLVESGTLNIGEALSYAEQILEAISSAHQVGVLHRDLKPENVLSSATGQLKVTDFGLARAASDVSLSTTGSIMGTVSYMAPEIALAGISDERTDIYAVGLMLYEMITGEVPLASESPMRIAYARVHEDIPAPSLLVPWLPTEIDDLVTTLCARDPQERPRTATQAAELVVNTRKQISSDLLSRKAERKSISPQNSSSAQTILVESLGETTALPVESQMIRTSSGNPDNPGTHTSKNRKTPLIIVILALIIAGAAGGIWWWWQYGPGSYITVPDLEGKPQVEAEKLITDLGLGVLIEQDFSDDVTEGNIISTDPDAGQSIHKNGTVTLLVSSGVEMKTVPELEGLSLDEGKQALINAGLTLGKTTEVWSETVEVGLIVDSSTSAGDLLKHDSAIDVEVSKGKEPLSVPNIVGMLQSDAVVSIEQMGLTGSALEEYSNQIEAGKIISQSPSANSTIYRGDTLNYVVSLGPEYVTVPDVSRKQLDEATKILEEAGFTVEVRRLANFFDTVGSQSPSAGEQAKVGATITLTVV